MPRFFSPPYQNPYRPPFQQNPASRGYPRANPFFRPPFGRQPQPPQQGPVQQTPMQSQPQGQTGQPQPYQPPGLPPAGTDGVTYEPIDRKTLNELRRSLGETELPETGELLPPAPAPAIGAEASQPLAELLQNERNALAFYRHLASIAEPRHQQQLSRILSGVESRSAFLSQLYQTHYGKAFEPEDQAVDTGLSYRQGLLLAAEEEIGCMKKLSDLYENMQDDRIARKLCSHLYRKVGDLTFLSLAVNQLV